MVDEMRKQLDELMGVNRNGDNKKSVVTHYSDPRLCKADLLDLCPYLLFPNTKNDLGKCPAKICPVPDNFKKDFQNDPNSYEYGYEEDLLMELEKIKRKCDEKVIKKKRDLGQRGSMMVQSEPEELIQIKKQLEDLTKQVDELGSEGLIDEAQEVLEKIENLKKEKESYEVKLPKEQQLIICDICAATLSQNETDQRLADHFAGKAHIGLQKIRERILLLTKEIEQKPKKRKSPEKQDSHERRHSRERNYSSERGYNNNRGYNNHYQRGGGYNNYRRNDNQGKKYYEKRNDYEGRNYNDDNKYKKRRDDE
jgi:RNA-binding protein Luc7-like 2